MTFFHPALLAGALLFTVPLLIHLLNRQRHKKRPWAAMEFLLRAYQKQRNRLRNENLLLLLLRCLIPILLALAVARPLLREAAALIGGGGVVHHVFVLDGSYSMGVRLDGDQTPFERARGLIGRMLDRFEQNPNRNDKVSLVVAGVRPRFVVRGDLDLGAARNGWLLSQKPDDAATDLGESMMQVADALEESGDEPAQVYVFTDLQKRSMGEGFATEGDEAAEGPQLRDTLRDTVERIDGRENTSLHWIDVGPLAAQNSGAAPSERQTLDNAQITDLRLSEPAAVEKAPAEVIATLQNRGTSTATCEVTLEIDGGEPMRKIVQVPPGAEAEADFQLSFRQPGKHRLRASLVQDALAADDERFLTVDVRDRLRVLLVDGSTYTDPLKRYSYLWRSILDPDPELLPMFAVEVVDIVSLLGGQCTPKDHDVIVLADVERLNARASDALTDALRAGRGVLCMFGANADVESYNLHLYAAGDGPMPFRLLPAMGGVPGNSTPRQPSIVMPEHPALREFEEDVYREILQAIPVWRWHGVAADTLVSTPAEPITGNPGDGDDADRQDGAEQRVPAQIAVRLTDAEQTPLLVSRPFGEGQAVFLTSPISSEYDADRWNRLEDPLVAFPLLHGMVKWLALPATDPFAASIGSELTCSLPARPVDVQVERPARDGRPRSSLAEQARPLPGERFALPSFRDTLYAGFYEFDLALDSENGREPLRLPFAVNVDPAEGDLSYAAHADARTALGLERVLDSLPAVAEADDAPDSSDLGPSLLLLVLMLVVGEATLARFVAARRS